MPTPGQIFTNKRFPTPDEATVNSDLALVNANLNGRYPSPPPPNYPLQDSLRSYLRVAEVPTVNDAVITCTAAFGSPGDQATNGSIRFRAWGGHGDIETGVLDGWFGLSEPWPTDAVIRSKVEGGQLPPGQPEPPKPPKPPQPPETGSALEGRIAGLENAYKEAFGRIATLEAQMKGIRDALGATTGGPGGA